ncbi:hypothetical protein QR680_007123 [Steinernema hermaphroditum]|uniref:Vesicle transport protein n=1 Tax=Steinernema hermaphroditum TaxID=289476 RepID=A0AA39I099_9BILA|nr:hypothetical protein QR680_007123 [Steinernema hermaphroditum]
MDPESSQDESEKTGLLNYFKELTTLDFETRLWCFVGCLFLSVFSSFGSIVMLFVDKPIRFCIFITLGNIFAIGGTCFLVGPCKQLQKMFEPTRLTATLIYIIMTILTFVAGLEWHNLRLALLFVTGQCVAITWYSISYIPFARTIVQMCLYVI